MPKKISITVLFTLAFAFVALFGVSQVWAQCDPALSPGTQVIYTEVGALRLTVDPCTGQLILAEFCDQNLKNCRDAEWYDGMWCIGDSCRPWTAVVPSTQALPAAYSNLRCYYGGRV